MPQGREQRSPRFDAIELPQSASAVDVEQFVHSVRDRRRLVTLESLDGQGGHGRFSIVGFDPVLSFRCDGLDDADPFERLREPLDRFANPRVPEQLPFVGGWMGFLSYEAGQFLEKLPAVAARDLSLPYAEFGLYDTVAIFDHDQQRWFAAGVDLPSRLGPARPPLDERLAQMRTLIERARGEKLPNIAIPPSRPLDLDFDRGDYVRKVERILEHIRAGDIYQANLTQRFAVECSACSWEVYRNLRRTNPANYAAFLSCGDFDILSSSPELFLDVRGREVLTRPIKGTRPRSNDAVLDRAYRAELQSSEKDLAELTMIVDLERNDLGRVCDDISVRWPPVIETHPTVHHLVAEVRGRLRDGCDVIDLLRASFPGGSITGAPKIRAMQIIDQLEPVARGPYCGSIGYIGLDGRAQFNIAIRTMIAKGGRYYVHVGSGIVADSDPIDEYAELLAKAKGMFAALNVTAQPADVLTEKV